MTNRSIRGAANAFFADKPRRAAIVSAHEHVWRTTDTLGRSALPGRVATTAIWAAHGATSAPWIITVVETHAAPHSAGSETHYDAGTIEK